MLLKVPCKLGSTHSVALIQSSAIVAIVPKEEHSEVYIKNIATPVLVLVSFENLKAFLDDLVPTQANALSVAEYSDNP